MIHGSDRVSTVLRADESLVDVFVGLSPAFERLRNPAMRKVMARLVTVDQAARIAGVDAAELVARLNGGGSRGPAEPVTSGDRGGAEPAPTQPTPPGPPPALAAMPRESIVELDVREDLRNGREPFSRIMAARREVPSGGALRVRAIFEPVPLYAVMEKQGLAHHTEQLGPEDWRVWFYAEPSGAGADEAAAGDAAPAAAELDAAPAATEPAEGVVVLDVRGLEPPEPMLRTLAALERLPVGGTLVQINVRVPRFLLPHLEQRGFAYEVREQQPDLVRIFIRRAPTG